MKPAPDPPRGLRRGVPLLTCTTPGSTASIMAGAEAPAPSRGSIEFILHPLTALADGHTQGLELAPADHANLHLASDPATREERLKLFGVCDRRVV